MGIAVIGASSGGVMALLGAIQLYLNLYKVRMVQTTGMPRPGNRAMSKYVSGHHIFQRSASSITAIPCHTTPRPSLDIAKLVNIIPGYIARRVVTLATHKLEQMVIA